MKHAAYTPEKIGRVSTARLWWVGPLTVVASVGANAVVRTIALALFEIPPDFHHLMWGHLIPVTVVAVGSAAVVFAVVARYARRPLRLYLRIAAVVLVLSLAPDIALFFKDNPSHNPAGVVTLMAMHVVDAVISVGLLTALTRRRKTK